MPTTFAKVLQIIADRNYDANKMVIELAKTNPELFLELAGHRPAVNDLNLTLPELMSIDFGGREGAGLDAYRKIFQTVASGSPSSKIEAIKQLRTLTGFGLRDAKDIIDNVVNYAVSSGYNVEPCMSAVVLDDERRWHYSMIVTAPRNI